MDCSKHNPPIGGAQAHFATKGYVKRNGTIRGLSLKSPDLLRWSVDGKGNGLWRPY